MEVPLTWLALAAATTTITALVLGFIARRERNRPLEYWALGWGAWALAVFPIMVLGSRPAPLAMIACGLLWVVSTICFLTGTYAFSERRLPRAWLLVGVACATLAVILGMGPVGVAGMVPLVLFQTVGLIANGILILRAEPQRAGAWLYGVSVIILGLQVLSAPVAATYFESMAWGFVVSTSLTVIAALGMLTLHYEHAREQLSETQRQLDGARRTEALGRIAGGVAHDFNNMLTVIQGHMDLIRLAGDRSGSLDRSLAAIEQAAEQAGRLTAQLLAFGRRAVVSPEAVDVCEVISSTLQLLNHVIPETISLEFDCKPGRYTASLDRGLLEQVVLNLVSNARDAISGDGQITLEVEGRQEPHRELCLRVSDDGAGMDPRTMDRVFEPFFTTKAKTTGTGLGLASVQGAVTQMGGSIRVTSELGKGTCFEVLLPWVEPSESTMPPSGDRVAGVLAVLLVDDDERVRDVTARMLESGGHRVDVAGDGEQALRLLRENGYDMVLTDVVMPKMGGLELAAAVEEIAPQTLVVLASGYPLDETIDPSVVHFIPKPFQRRQLLESIAAIAGRRRSEASARQ
jgi:signal transduction histidine kinase/CheY-like chemotaxis protein